MEKKSIYEATMANILWHDRKRHLGLPLSFTKYSMSEDRLFVETGFLNLEQNEVRLYRILDLQLKRSFGQRIFGVGSIILQQLNIGNNVRLGAGSVMMTKPKDGNLYIGVPAKKTEL